jgi:hypothetical protein
MASSDTTTKLSAEKFMAILGVEITNNRIS